MLEHSSDESTDSLVMYRARISHRFGGDSGASDLFSDGIETSMLNPAAMLPAAPPNTLERENEVPVVLLEIHG